MSDSILNLILRLRKQGGGAAEAAADLDKLKKKSDETKSGLGGMVNGLADVKAGFDMVSQVVAVAGQAFDATVGKAAAWGDEMGDLAQLTGTGVKATSEFAATMELMGIKSGDLTKTIKALTTQGLQPTMENIKRLAAEYQAIQDPVAKNAFLFKNFGKQAGDVAEVLGKSTEELEALTQAARASGKVIDENAAAAAERFNIRLAELQQKAEGVAITIGTKVIVAWDALTDAQEANNATATDAQLLYASLAGGMDITRQNVGTLSEETAILETATHEAAVQFDTFGLAAYGAATASFSLAVKEQEAAKAAQDLKQAESDLATAIAGPIGKENENYIQQQADIRLKMQDVQGEIDKLNAKKYLTPEQQTELGGLKTTLGDLQKETEKNAETHEEATARIVFGFLQQRMAADGLQDGEITALAKIGRAWGIYDEDTARALEAVDKSIAEHGTNAAAIIKDVGDAIDGLPDTKEIVIQVRTNGAQIGDENFGGYVAPAGSGKPPAVGLEEGVKIGGANGLDMIVPPGYPNDSFPVWAQSGERVTITPAGQTTNMGGVTINVSGAGDPQAVAREVSRLLAAQARGLTQSGAALMGG